MVSSFTTIDFVDFRAHLLARSLELLQRQRNITSSDDGHEEAAFSYTLGHQTTSFTAHCS